MQLWPHRTSCSVLWFPGIVFDSELVAVNQIKQSFLYSLRKQKMYSNESCTSLCSCKEMCWVILFMWLSSLCSRLSTQCDIKQLKQIYFCQKQTSPLLLFSHRCKKKFKKWLTGSSRFYYQYYVFTGKRTQLRSDALKTQLCYEHITFFKSYKWGWEAWSIWWFLINQI